MEFLGRWGQCGEVCCWEIIGEGMGSRNVMVS